MSDKRVIAVVGATGAQGGGLARAILADPQGGFAVRALTRDPSSDAAQALADQGAEVVKADIDDEESVNAAFEGAHGAFCVTFFWAHLSAATEQVQAGNMARAAKRADVNHVIWSTLEDTRRWLPITDDRMPVLQDKYNVPHYDGKAEADPLFTGAEVPTTFLWASFYWENFIYLGMGPQRADDGTYGLTMPMGTSKLPGIASEDIGKCAYGIFNRGDELVGETIAVAGEHLTGAQMAESFSKALGVDVAYNEVSPDTYRGFGFPGADEVGNMLQFKRDFEDVYCGPRDIAFARSLNPELQTFDEWLAKNVSRIPLG